MQRNILNVIRFILKIPAYITAFIIDIYQFFFSFDHSFWARPDKIRICTYYPSCSEFSRQAILKHGLVLGSIMGVKRVIDCNPRSHGGLDPVPEKFSLKRYRGKGAKPAF